MIKVHVILFALLALVFTSCKDDDAVFEQSADERSAAAISALRSELTAQPWRTLYKPVDDSGSFWVLLNFNSNGSVTLQSDLAADDGRYFEQTITYRIDNSLGLELIFETYCMFSYLFEQYSASFHAEFEFNYVNKTPDNHLVFSSKTDPDAPTVLLLQPSTAEDVALLGRQQGSYLHAVATTFNMFSSPVRLSYSEKDLMFSVAIDEVYRNIRFVAASRKSSTANVQLLTFSTTYTLKGDSVLLATPFQQSLFGNAINIQRLRLSSMTSGSFNGCSSPIALDVASGTTSQGDNIRIESTLDDFSGGTFVAKDFYYAPLSNIRNNREAVVDQIQADITGAVATQLYYNNDGFYGIGFVIENPDRSITFALREFTPVLEGNHIRFQFAPGVSIFGDPTEANTDNINIYLDALTQGDNTYVFKYGEGVFEFHNPCTGWSFVYIEGN